MRIMGIEMPQAAIDAGNAAMTGMFRINDIRGAVSAVLHDLYHEGVDHAVFDYGIQSKEAVHDRLADKLMQDARKRGRIRFLGAKGWKAEG